MGAQLGGGGRGRRKHRMVTDINVTPLVDVMLVLLIVFMVTAPMMTSGVPVNLPETDAANISSNEEPLVVTVTQKGDVYLQESTIKMDELPARLQAIIGEKKDTIIYIRGDKTVPYGTMLQVMGTVNAAGFSKVSLVSESKR